MPWLPSGCMNPAQNLGRQLHTNGFGFHVHSSKDVKIEPREEAQSKEPLSAWSFTSKITTAISGAEKAASQRQHMGLPWEPCRMHRGTTSATYSGASFSRVSPVSQGPLAPCTKHTLGARSAPQLSGYRWLMLPQKPCALPVRELVLGITFPRTKESSWAVPTHWAQPSPPATVEILRRERNFWVWPSLISD